MRRAHAVVNLLGECYQHMVGEVGFAAPGPVVDLPCELAAYDPRLQYLPDAWEEPALAGNPWIDGRRARVRLYASAPLVLPDGRVLGTLCVFDDRPGRLAQAQRDALTDLAAQAVALFEQVRAARQLADALEEVEALRDEAVRRGALTGAILETIDVGIVACDPDGRLTLFNRATRELHGLPLDRRMDPELHARRYSLYAEDGVTPLTRREIPLMRTLQDGEVRDATIVIAPDGLPAHTLRCDGRALHEASGRLLGAVVAMTDVTEARRHARELTGARDQALASTRAKSAFLAAASHEIRTPLNGVLGTLELLGLQDLTPQQRSYVDVARRSSEVLLALLNDVLDLSKAESTRVVLAAEPFAPAAVAGDVVAALGPVAERKGLRLRLAPGADDRLVGDASRLRQVLLNLVGNAVKFTDTGSVDVTVTTTAAGPGRRLLAMTVRDTGAGIAADEMDGLFQPFAQGAQGERHGGTGLGLALSAQLVERMGGTVTVESEPGRGSTFTVLVELPEVVGVVERAAEAVPAPRLPHRPRVLIADDSEVNRLVAEALLAVEGADVVTVTDGDEAVEAVRTGAYDLVLLDNRMPRMSGPEAARAIRALPGTAGRTRLLALTASATDEDRERCEQAGMEGVLLKPVRGEDLRRVLQTAPA